LRDGAALVRDASDVAAELGFEIRPLARAARGGGLADALPPDVPVSLEDLQALSGQALPELLAELSRLELQARVRRLPGPLYLRISPERV
jgi:predicted Rossmann fold nucleotide-binding protein DprA/Smf involved in DNA uptake